MNHQLCNQNSSQHTNGTRWPLVLQVWFLCFGAFYLLLSSLLLSLLICAKRGGSPSGKLQPHKTTFFPHEKIHWQTGISSGMVKQLLLLLNSISFTQICKGQFSNFRSHFSEEQVTAASSVWTAFCSKSSLPTGTRNRVKNHLQVMNKCFEERMFPTQTTEGFVLGDHKVIIVQVWPLDSNSSTRTRMPLITELSPLAHNTNTKSRRKQHKACKTIFYIYGCSTQAKISSWRGGKQCKLAWKMKINCKML